MERWRKTGFPARIRALTTVAEVGIELKLVTPHELAALIPSGEFVLQLHIGALMLADMRGHLDLAALR
jgi:hypothetical protein